MHALYLIEKESMHKYSNNYNILVCLCLTEYLFPGFSVCLFLAFIIILRRDYGKTINLAKFVTLICHIYMIQMSIIVSDG